MRASLVLVLPFLGLAACTDAIHGPQNGPDAEKPAEDVASAASARPIAAPKLTVGQADGRLAIARPAAARPEAYDQSSADEKAAASAVSAGQERKLGSTLASLGNPTEQGFWIKTPLVKAEAKGRLVHPASGKSVNVDLIPRKGAESGGSQVSLAALQMLGVSLTDLPRLDVYQK